MGSSVGMTLGIMPRRNSPDTESFSVSIMSFILVLSLSTLVAWAMIFSPMTVRAIGFFWRSNSCTESSSSSFLTCMERVGWVTKHFSAAVVKLP